MRRNLFVISFFICLPALVFICCQKKIFGNVEVKGRLVHFYTGLPTTGKVTLFADNVHSSSSCAPESILLATAQAGTDGNFTLKSKLSKGKNYYLHINDWRFYDYQTEQSAISISKNKETNLGDIIAGEMTFICKIKIVSVSGKSLWLFKTDSNNFTYYAPGSPETTVVQVQNFDAKGFKELHHSFPLKLKIDNYNSSDYYILADKIIYVPINSSDTLNYTINY